MNPDIACQRKAITLHASQVRADWMDVIYEFSLDSSLQLVECGKVVSLSRGLIAVYHEFHKLLPGKLFELNHVRLEENDGAEVALDELLAAFAAVGVCVEDKPEPDSVAACYRPVGRLSHPIRFYYDANRSGLVFLSEAVRLQVVSIA